MFTRGGPTHAHYRINHQEQRLKDKNCRKLSIPSNALFCLGLTSVPPEGGTWPLLPSKSNRGIVCTRGGLSLSASKGMKRIPNEDDYREMRAVSTIVRGNAGSNSNYTQTRSLLGT